MNDLLSYIQTNDRRCVHKWINYLDAYEKHLSKYRNTEFVLLEIGVNFGGSLQMWRDYFGPKCKIYGVDIDHNCKITGLEDEGFEIIIGDQGDREFLKKIKKQIPKIDVIIDDGGHYGSQQINTYEELFYHLSDDGVYIVEDLHTSYWEEYEGGYKNEKGFIEYSKNFIDYLHAWRIKEPLSGKMISFSKAVKSIHYYESLLIIEKGKVEKPKAIRSGYHGHYNSHFIPCEILE